MLEFGEIVLTIVASLSVGYIVLLAIGFLFGSDRIDGSSNRLTNRLADVRTSLRSRLG